MKHKPINIFNIAKLREDLMTARIIKRNINLEIAATESGISKATLCRIENSKTPDIETFGRLCKWLKKDPSAYFNA